MSKKVLQDVIPDEVILSKIFFLRSHKVMLDRDLAELYNVKAIRLREQVKRNLEKFPSHFMFQLTNEEVEIMVSQNAIPSRQHLGGTSPYVFTEHGVLQLANVLKSVRATQMGIKIIEVFVKMREMIFMHKDILLKLEQMENVLTLQDRDLKKNSDDIQLLFTYLKELLSPTQHPRNKVGYKFFTEE